MAARVSSLGRARDEVAFTAQDLAWGADGFTGTDDLATPDPVRGRRRVRARIRRVRTAPVDLALTEAELRAAASEIDDG